jgi:hypothetical protein
MLFLLLLIILAFATDEKETKESEPKNKQTLRWQAVRWSKNENKTVHNGTYKNEETAARASDALARKLIANGEKDLEFNLPDDDTAVYPENKTNKRKRSSDFEKIQKRGYHLSK